MEQEILLELSSNNIRNIFGKLDENIKIIEKHFNIAVINRDGVLCLKGEHDKIKRAKEVILQLEKQANSEEIAKQQVNYMIDISNTNDLSDLDKLQKDVVAISFTGKQIKPKTLGQKIYVDNIEKNIITFGVGPAGTGKTYLAMAKAITAFKKNDVNRIILTRPAIEAGENLGFLPGDLQQKVDPYLRPLYDALYDIMGADSFLKNLERGNIEIAPLAYMRGRTLDNAFIVLDEAQNTTKEQMKMFLTRLGFNSKIVITGDVTQIDLPQGKVSGLKDAISILDNIEEISICKLTTKDVVRNPLVQKIVKAYDKVEESNKNSKPNDKRRENTKR